MTVFVINPRQMQIGFERKLLGISVARCMTLSIAEAGYRIREEGEPAPEADDIVAAVLAPAPLLLPAAWKSLSLSAESGPSRLASGKKTLAIAGTGNLFPALLDEQWEQRFFSMEVGAAGHLADSARGVLACQEELQRRINQDLLDNDVQLVDPKTTYVSPGALIQPGCLIMPGCHIYGDTVIGEGSVIGPDCFLQDARLGKNVRVNASQIYSSKVGNNTTIGPFAYLRPGCDIGANVRIGDFVELKNTCLGDGTKVSHLTYLGDSHLGSRVNVGCGVVTVNYDGVQKHRTTVEDDAFIGCNVNLIAPVTVGEGAYLAAGTTITHDVERDALAIGRARQESKRGWAAGRREKKK